MSEVWQDWDEMIRSTNPPASCDANLRITVNVFRAGDRFDNQDVADVGKAMRTLGWDVRSVAIEPRHESSAMLVFGCCGVLAAILAVGTVLAVLVRGMG